MDLWRPVNGFPKYSVSRLGEVRRDSSGRMMIYKVNQHNVVYVGLSRNKRQYHRGVALLVANAFISSSYPSMDTPINLNGDRYDNRVENLVWRPRWFAIQYNRQFRDSYDNPIYIPITDIETGEEYFNSFDCAIKNGLLERDVVLSIINRTYAWPTYQQFGIIE